MNLEDMILTDEQSNLIWDRFYEEFDFRSNSKINKDHSFDSESPFKIKKPYIVYAIENMTERHINEMDKIMKKCFSELMSDGRKMYALDWQHTSYKYDPEIPCEIEEQWRKGLLIKDDSSWGGYMAYYPPFYPDGDYYFFVEENFDFGLLGHPWRREIWIFGIELIEKLSPYTKSIGWSELMQRS